MSKRILSKVITAVLTVSLTATLLSGCASKSKDAGKSSSKKDVQSIVYNMGAEPDSIDPGLGTAIGASSVDNAMFEGLMKFDKDLNPVPAAAEKVDYDKNNPVKFTFHIRKDAKWSDGKDLKAQDFVYAWLRVLNPKTAAGYATQLYYLKNGEAYNLGKAKASDVGVKAVDDKTLEVELQNPTPYFLQLTALATLMPVRQDIVEKDPEKWTQNPDTFIGNGPFKMTKWTHDSEIDFVKNDNYWDKKEVKLDKLKFLMMTDSSSALSAYETGDIDYLDTIPATDVKNYLADGKAKAIPSVQDTYIAINSKKKLFQNVKLRKALSLAIDRQGIADAVFQDGRKPATGFIPFGIKDSDSSKEFRTVGGDYYSGKADIAQAKKLLAEAGYPNGKGLPTIEYSYNSDPVNKQVAQALQDMWKKIGVNVKLNEVEWKVLLTNLKQGKFDISRDNWIGDYMDPMTFMQLVVSNDGNNDGKYKNSKYDKLIAAAKLEKDPAKRMQYIHQAEDILMGDVGVIPVVFGVSTVAAKPYCKGVVKTPLGGMSFDRAYVQGK
ncbi:peptide ABC transporter substrate-binding protein [Clostridium oryzae]|uniref:Oligopeptide-binding protein OppA n=1 Tax=Clostridium oryzae TaxID=1450648 RepID=A0A1V4I9F2_9CLOT|nr:peptide ABC transporter substrate-binding protein [Clostridium oryzae]OPJ56543.1 oligopeptide-binding protein OppA precursor [Clostridium oryzae]